MSVTFNPENHTYTNNNGQVIPSVTQIINQVLGNDYQGVNQELLEKSAKRGTLLHEQASLLLKGQEYEPYTEIITLKHYLEQHNLSLVQNGSYSELIVSATTPFGDYAGTLDYYDPNQQILYDFKFTTTKHLESWTWQLSLYAYALQQHDSSMKVTKAKILQLNEHNLKVIPLELKTTEEVEEFVHKH